MVGDRNKASSDEPGSPEKADQEAYSGTLRSYDCNFCKRGFTTAQALGGHMNVHRKDRAKLQRAGEASTPWKDDLRSVSCYQYYYHHSSRLKYNSAVPESPTMGFRTSGGRGRRSDDVGSKRPLEELRLFGSDLHLGFVMRGLVKSSEDGEEKVYDEESGLDLELRLGYDP